MNHRAVGPDKALLGGERIPPCAQLPDQAGFMGGPVETEVPDIGIGGIVLSLPTQPQIGLINHRFRGYFGKQWGAGQENELPRRSNVSLYSQVYSKCKTSPKTFIATVPNEYATAGQFLQSDLNLP